MKLSPEPWLWRADDSLRQKSHAFAPLKYDKNMMFPVLVAVIAGELGRQRGEIVPRSEWAAWSVESRLEDELGIDSLSRLGLVGRITRVFELDRHGLEDYALLARSLGELCELVLEAIERQDGNRPSLLFETSGTSGPAKTVRHLCETLAAEASAHAARFADTSRVVVLVPPHHIYGFIFGVLLPRALEVEAVDLRGATGQQCVRALRSGDLLVATPHLVQLLLASRTQMPGDIMAVTSGAAAPEMLWAGMQAAGAKSLVEVYGSTETGGVGIRTEPRAPFSVLPHLSFSMADDRTSDEGLEAWLAENESRLPDHIERLGAGRFRLVGRRDGAFQIGGTNVFPDHVRRVLLAHGSVGECALRRCGPAGEERLKAFIVPSKSGATAALRAELRAYIIQHLDPPARPVSLTFGDELPWQPSGKIADWDVDIVS